MANDGKRIEMCLQSLEDGTWGLQRTLSECFNLCGEGIAYKAKPYDAIDLVLFAYHCARMANDIPSSDASARVHFLSCLDSTATKLEMIAKRNGTYEAEKESLWARELYGDAHCDITSLHYCNVYLLILNSWEELKNWQVTYRLLSSVVSLQADWNDSDSSRKELIDIITGMALNVYNYEKGK